MNSSVANSREIARATWIRMFCSGCETRSEAGRARQGGGTNARGRGGEIPVTSPAEAIVNRISVKELMTMRTWP